MESGANKSLFTLLAIVIFGIFLSLSYWLFQDEMTNVLASVPKTVTSLGHAFVAFNPNLEKLYIPNSFKEVLKKNNTLTEPYSRILLNTYVWHEATNTVDSANYYESPILIFY